MRKTKMCWVCGKQVGPKFYVPKFTYAVVRDAIGNEHPTHLVCVKDADGRFVRNEKFHTELKGTNEPETSPDRAGS